MYTNKIFILSGPNLNPSLGNPHMTCTCEPERFGKTTRWLVSIGAPSIWWYGRMRLWPRFRILQPPFEREDSCPRRTQKRGHGPNRSNHRRKLSTNDTHPQPWRINPLHHCCRLSSAYNFETGGIIRFRQNWRVLEILMPYYCVAYTCYLNHTLCDLCIFVVTVSFFSRFTSVI